MPAHTKTPDSIAAASKPAHTAQYPCAHRQTRDSIQARAGHPRAPAHSQGEPRLPTLTRDCGRRWRVPAKALLRARSVVAPHERSSERRRHHPARGRQQRGSRARHREWRAPAHTTPLPSSTAAVLRRHRPARCRHQRGYRQRQTCRRLSDTTAPPPPTAAGARRHCLALDRHEHGYQAQ
jgi:hypothetical protein